MSSLKPAPGERTGQAMRKRNPVTTKAAILEAARDHFLRESFESVGLRDIARDAAVDPALIARYFAGKEGLFRAVAEDLANPEPFADLPLRPGLAAYLAAIVQDAESGGQSQAAHACLLMTRSASSPFASSVVRELIGRLILNPLAQRLGQDGERRARLIMTVVMGASLLKALEAEGEDSGDEASRQRRLGDLERLFEAALSA